MLQPICWLILAAIHFMPALAAVRPAMLTKLYRLQPDNPLFLLMHHRAALFVAVLLACIIAAFHAPSRPLAVAVTATSMISFLLLYVLAGQPPALRTIARVDMFGLLPLAVVTFLAFRN